MTYTPHPLRFQLSRKKGYRKPEGGVVVTRASRWGNPFIVGERYLKSIELGWGIPTLRQLGPMEGGLFVSVDIETVEQAVEMYRAWMKSCMTTALKKTDPTVLRGKQLGCFCSLNKPCHAAVLAELANK